MPIINQKKINGKDYYVGQFIYSLQCQTYGKIVKFTPCRIAMRLLERKIAHIVVAHDDSRSEYYRYVNSNKAPIRYIYPKDIQPYFGQLIENWIEGQ
jgi:hypothetical protein